MEKTADGKHRMVVRRRMPAPREIVYAGWIDPEGIHAGDVVSAEAFLDVRVGGSFRIIMRAPNRVHEHTGTYQIVDPPAKLAFTWSGLENPAEITLVTVEFLAHGDESEVVITHERFTKADVAQRYEMGGGRFQRNSLRISRTTTNKCKDSRKKQNIQSGKTQADAHRCWIGCAISIPRKGSYPRRTEQRSCEGVHANF